MCGMGHLELSQRELSGPTTLCVFVSYIDHPCMKALLNSRAVSFCRCRWCSCPLMGLRGAKERETARKKCTSFAAWAISHRVCRSSDPIPRQLLEFAGAPVPCVTEKMNAM